MANMEKRSDFEDQWRDAFEDAEISPSANLWKNIDNQLTMQENGKYRKGFIFYRAVAAACIVCLLALGYYVLQNNMGKSEQELANQSATQQQGQAPEQKANDGLALENNNEAPEHVNEQQLPDRASQSTLNNTLAQENRNETEEAGQSSEQAKADISVSHKQGIDAGTTQAHSPKNLALTHKDNARLTPGAFGNHDLSNVLALSSISSMGPELTEIEVSDWTKDVVRLYSVPQVIVDDKGAKQKPEFFAGLNLATNYFDPNFSSGANSAFAHGLSPAADENYNVYNLDQGFSTLGTRSSPANSGLENKPRLSLSYGVDVGVMLTEHISLESGLDYGRMNTSTRTSWIAEDYAQGQRIPLLASNAQAEAAFSRRTQFSQQELELTNSFAFLSVPLKLGYNLGFERIHFNLSSGVAANFFLNNRLSDESGQLSTVNISANTNSPYRPVYYSGVVSGGVNYLIASNYAVSVSPNYNFSLSALTENGNNFSSQPNAFGVDFGLRYNFR